MWLQWINYSQVINHIWSYGTISISREKRVDLKMSSAICLGLNVLVHSKHYGLLNGHFHFTKNENCDLKSISTGYLHQLKSSIYLKYNTSIKKDVKLYMQLKNTLNNTLYLSFSDSIYFPICRMSHTLFYMCTIHGTVEFVTICLFIVSQTDCFFH